MEAEARMAKKTPRFPSDRLEAAVSGQRKLLKVLCVMLYPLTSNTDAWATVAPSQGLAREEELPLFLITGNESGDRRHEMQSCGLTGVARCRDSDRQEC